MEWVLFAVALICIAAVVGRMTARRNAAKEAAAEAAPAAPAAPPAPEGPAAGSGF